MRTRILGDRCRYFVSRPNTDTFVKTTVGSTTALQLSMRGLELWVGGSMMSALPLEEVADGEEVCLGEGGTAPMSPSTCQICDGECTGGDKAVTRRHM